MEQLTNLGVEELPTTASTAVLVVAILVGLLYCFVGYRIFRILLALTGFILAGSAAAIPVAWLTQGRLAYIAAAMVLGGIAGAYALYALYRAGVFILGLLGAALVAYISLDSRTEPWVIWAILGAAASGGLAALWLERHVMTFATAAIGAYAVCSAAVLLLIQAGFKTTFEDPAYRSEVAVGMFACWAALTLIGALVQIVTFKPAGK